MWFSIDYELRGDRVGVRSCSGHNLVEAKIGAGRLYLTFEEDNGETYDMEIWLNSIKKFEAAGKTEED